MSTSTTDVVRSLSELKVVDLRNELEARALDKTGVKQTLQDRLTEALKAEGHDPATFKFTVKEAVKLTARKTLPVAASADNEAADEDTSADNVVDEEDDEGEGNDTLDINIEGAAVEDSVVGEGEVEGDQPAPPPAAKTTTATTTTTAAADTDTVFNAPAAKPQRQPPPSVLVTGTGTTEGADKENATTTTGGFKPADLEPPPPESVTPVCPLTSADTVQLHAAAHPDGNGDRANDGGGDTESMICEASSTVGMSRSASAATALDDRPSRGCSVGDDEDDGGTEEPPQPMIVPHDVADDEEQPTTKPPAAADTTAAAAAVVAQPAVAISTAADPESAAPAAAAKPDDEQEGRNLWVTGLAMNTRAADLKTLFTKYGRVVAAKIITSAKAPASNKCFGFVTMANADEASKCIQHLHRAELKGRMIGVERKKGNALPFSLAKPAAPAAAVATASAAKPAAAKAVVDSDDIEIIGERKAGTSRASSKAAAGRSASEKRRGEARSKPRASGAAAKRSRIEPPAYDARRAISSQRGRGGGYVRGRGGMIPRGGGRPVPTYSAQSYAARKVAQARLGPRGLSTRPRPLVTVGGRGGRGDPRMMRGGRNSRSVYDIAAGQGRPPMQPPPVYHHQRPEPVGYAMEEQLRRREEEHRRREEKLRLERERERLRYERERLEREKLELQQMKLSQQQQQHQPMYDMGAAAGYGGGAPDYRRGGGGGGHHSSARGHSSSRSHRVDSYRAGEKRTSGGGGYAGPDASRPPRTSRDHYGGSRAVKEPRMDYAAGGYEQPPQQHSRRSSSRSHDTRYGSSSRSVERPTAHHRSSGHQAPPPHYATHKQADRRSSYEMPVRGAAADYGAAAAPPPRAGGRPQQPTTAADRARQQQHNPPPQYRSRSPQTAHRRSTGSMPSSGSGLSASALTEYYTGGAGLSNNLYSTAQQLATSLAYGVDTSSLGVNTMGGRQMGSYVNQQAGIMGQPSGSGQQQQQYGGGMSARGHKDTRGYAAGGSSSSYGSLPQSYGGGGGRYR